MLQASSALSLWSFKAAIAPKKLYELNQLGKGTSDDVARIAAEMALFTKWLTIIANNY